MYEGMHPLCRCLHTSVANVSVNKVEMYVQLQKFYL